MSMNLVIVESPTKAKTLSKFLGNTYTIKPTLGHVRDLPKASLGIDILNGFYPKYILINARRKMIQEVKDSAFEADQIILATDPDREGEAIAWHITELLKTVKGKVSKVNPQRIVFHEITKRAVLDALKNPRDIDMKLVNAQQARRVLDRLVGYKLSPLLWQKLSKRWLSAGRVQSVTVRFIVEREREIKAFQVITFYKIEGNFLSQVLDQKSIDSSRNEFKAMLRSKDNVPYEKTEKIDLFDGSYSTTFTTIQREVDAQRIINDLQEPFTVSSIEKKEIVRNPPPPFTTSTLQQHANRFLYFSSKRTMQVAQRLYERGLITYHRTDSVKLSEKFITEARSYISRTYGSKYVPKEARRYKTKSKVAQEAHEAIRPTDIESGIEVRNREDLNQDHTRLYELIWKRAVASQASSCIYDSTTIFITSANNYQFEAKGSVILFDGFLKILGKKEEEGILPVLKEGQKVILIKAVPIQGTTDPPPRYSEASLIKTLEEKGIGRPSTYAPIISTIQDRQYVDKEEKLFVPTSLGEAVVDFLVEYFPDIMSPPFTADLEEKLDDIANGGKDWQPVIKDFYVPFSKKLEQTYENAQTIKAAEETLDEKCPQCGSTLALKIGKYGKFIACTAFPKCKYSRKFLNTIGMPCPKCGGEIVLKRSRRGKSFYGCSNYPSCKFAAWKKSEITYG